MSQFVRATETQDDLRETAHTTAHKPLFCRDYGLSPRLWIAGSNPAIGNWKVLQAAAS